MEAQLTCMTHIYLFILKKILNVFFIIIYIALLYKAVCITYLLYYFFILQSNELCKRAEERQFQRQLDSDITSTRLRF